MKRHPLLERLDVLVGTWEVEIDAEMPVKVFERAWSTFSWLEGGFLMQRSEGEIADGAPPEWVAGSPLPATMIVGLDDTNETLSQLYADNRGVRRIYQMSFADDVWRLWRASPGFHQRFHGTLSGTTITAEWEKSEDGERWQRDFGMTYTRSA